MSRSSDRCVNEFIDCVDSSSADCVLAIHVDINVDHLHIVMDCVVMYGLRHAVTNCAFKLQSPRCSNGMPCFVVQLFSNHWRIQEGLGGSMPLPKRPVNLFVLQKNGFQGKLLVTMQKGVQHPLTRGSAREPRWSLCLRPRYRFAVHAHHAMWSLKLWPQIRQWFKLYVTSVIWTLVVCVSAAGSTRLSTVTVR